MLRLQVRITVMLFLACLPIGAGAGLPACKSSPCKVVVIGFVGGMRSPDDLRQGVVQIGNRLRSLDDPDLQVNVYRHWHWRRAYQFIRRSIDRNRDNDMSKEEIDLAPKVIVYGHSLGGWAVVKLTGRLNKAGVPVELAVQLDSVGIGDEVVPGNVKFAANFYQRTVWPIRGEKKIRAKDPGRTKILGNFLIREVGHEAMARETEISDFIAGKISLLCATATAAPDR
jgi:hypothetical protein